MLDKLKRKKSPEALNRFKGMQMLQKTRSEKSISIVHSVCLG